MRTNYCKPIAIFVADIHLSLRPPIWRSAEPDWLKAMKRQLSQLTSLRNELGVPVICAGDVFDKWYGAHQSSELVNFAIDNLPIMYAIPGQHDLPQHNYGEKEKSAYWTLVKTGRIIHLDGTMKLLSNGVKIRLTGIPFGQDSPTDSPKRFEDDGVMSVLVQHQYVWQKGAGYGQASTADLIKKQDLHNNDICVFGDNHIGFEAVGRNGELVWNCGGFFRRKSDEVNYEPRIGVLCDNNTVISVKLDVSEDVHLETVNPEDEVDIDDGLSEFVRELEKLGDNGMDFTTSIVQYVEEHKVSRRVKSILLKSVKR